MACYLAYVPAQLEDFVFGVVFTDALMKFVGDCLFFYRLYGHFLQFVNIRPPSRKKAKGKPGAEGKSVVIASGHAPSLGG